MDGKKRGTRPDTKSLGIDPITHTSHISIKDFLEVVKDTFQAVLSDDVLQYFNETCYPHGYYTDRVLYSVDDSVQVEDASVEDDGAAEKKPKLDREAYEATINIANGRDRRILYDINNVRLIDKKRAARGVVPSTNNGRGSLTKSNSLETRITGSGGIVKESFSVDASSQVDTSAEAVSEELGEKSRLDREAMPRKAREKLRGIENKLFFDIRDALGAHRLADHEAYHARGAVLGGLNEYVKEQILQRYSKEEFDRVLDKYMEVLWPVYGPEGDYTGNEQAYEAAVRQIEEELLADAYAGINAFGAGATVFTEGVNETMDASGIGRQRQENGVRQTDGPPSESYAEVRPKDLFSSEDMTEREASEGHELAEFINQVNGMINKSLISKRKYKIGSVSENHVKIINQIMQQLKPGFDATGYELWIDGTGAAHIEDRHGKFGEKDQSMASVEAKILIPWVAQNATSGKFILDKNGQVKLSDRYLDRDGKRAPEICLEKAVNNDIVYVSECVPDSKNKRIWITSAYIKKGSNGQMLNMEDPSLQLTPEAPFDDNATTDIVANEAGRVKESFSVDDSSYLDAVERGDMETAQRMVGEAARKAGYNSPLLYHGTKSFGFTEFDLSKMDDKRSIFLTDNERIAATYSGVMGTRNVSGDAMKPVEALSAAELVEELNSERFGVDVDPDDKTRYTYLSLEGVNDLISNVNFEIEALRGKVPQMIQQYADRMAVDFDSKDHRTHEQLVKLDRLLRGYDYQGISTQLYMLLHHTDAFNGTEAEATRIAKLEQDIRLLKKLEYRDNSDGAIVESWLNGYSLNVLDAQQARDRLEVKRKTGNYGMYGKLDNALVIDANGAVWNDIRHWSHAVGINVGTTRAERRGDSFVLIDKASGKEISEGSFFVNPYTENLSVEQLHSYMVQKAQSVLSIVTENLNNTRDIAAFAQNRGYDGVVFRNLRDNGGQNPFVDTEEQADIYVFFDPSQAKSADPVTYDDSGNVIPLSERFNFKKRDIRYSVDDSGQAEEGAEEDFETSEKKPKFDREALPRKARENLRGIEKELFFDIRDALGAHRLADRSYLKDMEQELVDEYLQTGAISQETIDRLFEASWARGLVIDRELHDRFEDVKKHLNTTAVTISESDKSSIADFKDFRRKTFRNLRIVNEGGTPVDVFYGELQDMAPALFPKEITHPADQLVKMFEVAKSLQISEDRLQDHYGSGDYRRWAKDSFSDALGKKLKDLREVKRYLDGRASALEHEKAPATAEEAMEVWGRLKEARKVYQKAMAKNLLTEEDEILVGRLLRGEESPENIDPEQDGMKGVLAVFEGKQEYVRLMELINEYRRHVRGQLRKEADGYLKTAGDWKDKAVGLAYSREIMQRNIEDIVPDPQLAKQINERYFEPVRDAEAQAVRMKDSFRRRAAELGLSRKVNRGDVVSEAHAVQLYGEAMDNIRVLEKAGKRLKHRDGKTLADWQGIVENLWLENPGLDQARIENAVKEFRKIYDELFREMNKVRVKWGYEPVNYREGYFPHFQPGDGDGILQQFGRALGIDTQVVALPTTINGLTHTFKPGIQWFGNAQERLGFNTAYDAVEGFDKYIEGIASVIHQTENIQKLRALAAQVRYRTTDEGIQEQVDEINADGRLTDEEKQAKIAQLYEHGKFSLSNFIVELDEYTNLLANKKSKLDRTVEGLIGRRFYTCMKWLESRVGANMIAGNLSSALTNFIPLTQAGAQVGYKPLLSGMWQTLKAWRTGDSVVGMSSFLTNRMGSDPLVQTWSQKASSVLSKPMELIDGFVSGSIVRAAYAQNLQRGMPESEAMHQADILASRIMAERSKGGMPTLFGASNPLFKVFTQFQLEVNNQFSEIFKDIPRAYRDKHVAALAMAFLRYFVGAWLFNSLYEKWIGRRPALDPIDIVLDLGSDLVGENAVGVGPAVGNFATAVLEELPFSSGLGLLGVELDGGRIPVSSAIPDLTALWDAATTEGWSGKKRWKEAQDELNKLAYVLPPFGGNQVSKIWKGVKAYIQGGSYSVDSAGNDILQYPVYNDETGDFWSLVRSMIMGKSSLDEAQEWVEDGFDSLGAKQTSIYQDMKDAGVSGRDAYGLLDALRSAKATETQTKADLQLGILRESEVSGDGKAIVFYGMLASEKERTVMDALADIGADAGSVTDTLMYLHDADGLKGVEKYKIQADVLIGSELTEEEKQVVIGSWLGTEEVTESGSLTAYGKFVMAMKSGISSDEYLKHRAAGGSIDDLLEYHDKGLSADDASELSLALDALKPEAGEERVTNLQRWRVCVDFPGDEEDHLTALSGVMTDSQLEKAERAWSFGVAPEKYVYFYELREKYDANDNGSYSQMEVTAAINAMGDELTNDQKAALWQIVTGSKKAANNPYNAEVGQRVIESKGE